MKVHQISNANEKNVEKLRHPLQRGCQNLIMRSSSHGY